MCKVFGHRHGTWQAPAQDYTAGADAVPSSSRTRNVTFTMEPTFSPGAIEGHPLASRNCRLCGSLAYSDLLYTPRLQTAG